MAYIPGRRSAFGLTRKLATFFLGRMPYFTKHPKSVLFTLTNISLTFRFLQALFIMLLNQQCCKPGSFFGGIKILPCEVIKSGVIMVNNFQVVGLGCSRMDVLVQLQEEGFALFLQFQFCTIPIFVSYLFKISFIDSSNF